MSQNGEIFFFFFPLFKNGLFVIWIWKKKKKISQKREAEKHGDRSVSDSWHTNLCQTLPPGPSLSHQNSKQGIRTHFPGTTTTRGGRLVARSVHPDRRKHAPLQRGAGTPLGIVLARWEVRAVSWDLKPTTIQTGSEVSGMQNPAQTGFLLGFFPPLDVI